MKFIFTVHMYTIKGAFFFLLKVLKVQLQNSYAGLAEKMTSC